MKEQFCLRSIPDDLWNWIEEEAFKRRENINAVMVSLLQAARQGGSGQLRLFPERILVQPADATTAPFRFIDLFAGIGGFRLGLQRLGGRCVFTSEWDRFSARTYEAWFGDVPEGDINQIDPNGIPDHDILAAGFPCQPFSIAGVSKKRSLGQADGFRCERQGNLFFRVCDIVAEKRPPVLMLENVKNLKSHDGGRTWLVIESSLKKLGYRVFHQVIDAVDWVPQHRERIFIVCFDRRVFGDEPAFQFPERPAGPRPRFRDILESEPDPKYTLTDHLWNYLQRYAEKHRAKGNGFGFGLTDLDGISRTLSARYYKDGSEILIPNKRGMNPRRLTIVEAARLMGFGEVVRTRADVPVSDTQAYRQFGNSVVPHVVSAVGREVIRSMMRRRHEMGDGCLLKQSARTPAAAAT